MFGFVSLFFIFPLVIAFLAFSFMGMLIFPMIVFFLVAGITTMLFSGVFYWIFLAILIAAAAYLFIKASEMIFKKLENRKLFKFIIIFAIIVISLTLIKKNYTHVDVRIIDNNTGSTIVKRSENIID